jgi:hypothetical protein
MKLRSIHIFVSSTCLLFAFTAHAQSWLLGGNSGTNTQTNFLGTKDSKSLVFRTNNIERMRIAKTGFVGIGTKSPQQALDVHGNIKVSGALYFQDYLNDFYPAIYNNGNGFFIDPPGDESLHIETPTETALVVTSGDNAIDASSSGGTIYSSSDNPFPLMQSSSAVYATALAGAGVAGFSDSSYGIYGSTSSPNSYAGYFSGGIYSTGTFIASDETLKQNVQDFSSALSIISQLHPKTYQYRQNNNYKLMKLPRGEHYGLIAQDVEKVLPNLVKDTKFNVGDAVAQKHAYGSKYTNPDASANKTTLHFKALNYTELIPVLIKGIQEQQQSIEELKQVNQQQQEQINQLKNLIETKLGNTDASNIQTTTLSSAFLLQNAPNPYKSSTTISYNLPDKFSSAQIVITNNAGQVLKQINVSGVGKGSVNIAASSLSAGSYNYALWIDGRIVDSKKMILQK